jgi:crotonobetainyl-CoA:carnitine CoA-transferase CaiB-like acyl-CoA transferase
MMHPLDGVKVLDLTRVLAGPWATMTLADLGAEVWKIEHPISGDDTRGWRPPEIGGESTYYLSANRNKLSVAVDLKTDAGRAIVRDLAAKADVLVENMRLGALERLGLGWDALHALNPRLIYCSLSGYGRVGPRAADPGYDAVIQAESGLMSITGNADGAAMKHGVAITDMVAGMNATQAILAALLARVCSGEGQFIDIALLDGAVALLANIGSAFLNTGTTPRRYGNGHPTVVPYGVYRAEDGDFVLGCGNDRQFRAVCVAVGRVDLADDARFRHNQDRQVNRGVLEPMLDAIFATRSVAHWLATLRAADVPAGEVRTLPEVFAAPEIIARGLVTRVPHPLAGEVAMVGSPLRLQETPPRAATAPPLLGEHTRAVLSDVLGLDAERIATLIAERVVVAPVAP